MIHIDVWGPYRVKTHPGCNQFITIVDDFTRFTWIHLLKYRTDVVTVMTNFFFYIHTQFNAKILCVRSDNAKELIEDDMKLLLLKFGIYHQTSCADTPQQNGVVERKHMHLLETARAIFLYSKVPDIFWGDNILCSAYLINRLPLSAVPHTSPYEKLYQATPLLDHLRIFSDVFASSLHQKFTDPSLLPEHSLPCFLVIHPLRRVAEFTILLLIGF